MAPTSVATTGTPADIASPTVVVVPSEREVINTTSAAARMPSTSSLWPRSITASRSRSRIEARIFASNERLRAVAAPTSTKRESLTWALTISAMSRNTSVPLIGLMLPMDTTSGALDGSPRDPWRNAGPATLGRKANCVYTWVVDDSPGPKRPSPGKRKQGSAAVCKDRTRQKARAQESKPTYPAGIPDIARSK